MRTMMLARLITWWARAASSGLGVIPELSLRRDYQQKAAALSQLVRLTE